MKSEKKPEKKSEKKPEKKSEKKPEKKSERTGKPAGDGQRTERHGEVKKAPDAFCLRVKRYMEERALCAKSDTIAVACSGGADSLCLLEVLYRLGFSVSAFYVHHGLRREADREVAFLRAFTAERGIPFSYAAVDVKTRVKETHESTEEAARVLRYEALAKLPASRIALAHHADDQAETVLFHLMRGSGIKGAGGMKDLRGRFIRPFLFLSKKEIVAWMRKEKIAYCEDRTNADDAITRNAIRHTVLPAMEKIRPGATRKLAEAAERFRETESYLEEEARRFLKRNAKKDPREHSIFIPDQPFLRKPKVLEEAVLRVAFAEIGFTEKDKSARHVENVRKLFEKPVGAMTRLKAEEIAYRTYEGVKLAKNSVSEGDDSEAFTPKPKNRQNSCRESGEASIPELHVRKISYRKGMKIPDYAYTKWFDYDILKCAPKLRTRKTGDRISCVKGTHKKLSDWMIDEKIPKAKRDRVWLVADGADVLWVIGHRMSEEYKVTANTKNVLEIAVSINKNSEA